eukprot:TRINITY_DN5958_c0_g1_i1.p1 TRINITY_DN5958_c0_g1~~TRINITY_DN5958_c0_g1_i1.p1  ORF type:complete len:202 (+),score=39.87 TRINITY_DN5958_c0_g1_i1:43-648(+)
MRAVVFCCAFAATVLWLSTMTIAQEERDDMFEIDDPTVRLLESRFTSYEQSAEDEAQGRAHRVVEKVFEIQRTHRTRLEQFATFLEYVQSNFEEVVQNLTSIVSFMLQESKAFVSSVLITLYRGAVGRIFSETIPNVTANILATHKSLSDNFASNLPFCLDSPFMCESTSSFGAGLVTSSLYFYPTWLVSHVLWYSIHGIM